MTTTLRQFVHQSHPNHLMEALDTTVLTDLDLASPTVIIEVVGAREGLDALARVRRVTADAPVAAVRISAIDVTREPSPQWDWVRSTPVSPMIILTVLVAFMVAAVSTSEVMNVAIRIGSLVAAMVLLVGGLRAWKHARRAPVERRRHFERRRSISVIAVPSADTMSASSLAASVRRELDTAPAGDAHVEVSVIDLPDCGCGGSGDHVG